MTRICLGLLLAVSALWGQGSRSLGFSGTQGLLVTLPNAAPFNSLGSCRWEFRIHGFSIPQPANQRIFDHGGLNVTLVGGATQIRVTNFLDGFSASIVIDIPNRTDIVVRLQRDIPRKRMSFQVWNADGSDPKEGTSALTGNPVNFTGTLFLGRDQYSGTRLLAGQLAYLRWYSDIVPLDAPPPSNLSGGTLAALELENNIVDSSGRNLTTTLEQTGVYSNTPVIALLPADFTVRAGAPFNVDASPSGAASYFWQQLSGPDTLVFANRTAAATKVTGAVAFGTYTLRLTVTGSSGQKATRDLRIGAVPTNADGVVLQSDPTIAFLTGPMLRDGLSPWPYYDFIRKDHGHLLGKSYAPFHLTDQNTPAAGTITLTQNSTTVTGVGTQFQSLFACNNSDEHVLAYYRDAQNQEGRSPLAVVACPSNTQITLAAPWQGTTQSGVRYQRWDANQAKRWSEGINYYDSVLVQYQNWYRTGIEDFRNYARTLADAWWISFQIDGGRNPNSITQGIVAPRRVALDGLLLRSFDGKPEYLPWLKSYTDTAQTLYQDWLVSSGGAFGYGTREPGYTFLFMVLLAKAHPDPAVRSAYLAKINARTTDFWYDYQCKADNPPNRCQSPAGAYRWPDVGFYAGNAELPFHVAIAMEGLAKGHQLTGNATLRTVIERFLEHATTAMAGNVPLYVTAVSGFNQSVRCRSFQYWAYATPGGASNSVGSLASGASCPTSDRVRDNRALNNEFPNIFGYAFRNFGKPFYKDFGDEVFAATFGKEQGPRTDGFYGRVDSGIGDYGKQYGQSLRSSGSYLATRLNSSTDAKPLPLSVGFSLASVPNAASVRLTLQHPSGMVTTATCATSPCAINADRIQGDHRLTLEYLSSANQVLATTQRNYTIVAP